MPGVPLVRWLSKCNAASRVEARALVRAGRVTLNGRCCRDGARRVDPRRDQVCVDGEIVRVPDPGRDLVWWALNKPRGVLVTTKDPRGRTTVLDLLPHDRAPGLAPVGRLDKASAGLLLLTNDATRAARLLDPSRHVEKVYRVKVRGHPGDDVLRAWREDTRTVEGLVLGPMAVRVERRGPKSTWLEVRLHEGKNRQIRRRLGADGHEVEVLVRTRFGPVGLADLAPGASRPLSPEEVTRLARAAGDRERTPRKPSPSGS